MARTTKKQACLARLPFAAALPEQNLEEDQEGILFALAEAVEQRDHHIAGHCQRLAFISVTLGAAMGLDRACLVALYRGGYLHDVGKVGIPDSILFKPGTLTASSAKNRSLLLSLFPVELKRMNNSVASRYSSVSYSITPTV